MNRQTVATSFFVALLLSLLRPLAAFAQADQNMPLAGGGGGGEFVARCARGEILAGFELQTGDDVDSIRPVCARPITSTTIRERVLFSRKFGGDGGPNTRSLVCRDDEPSIVGIGVDVDGEVTKIVNGIDIFCGAIVPTQPTLRASSGGFTGPNPGSSFAHTVLTFPDYTMLICPAGLVPVGIWGASGTWLDSVGLICGALPLLATSGIGRMGPPSDPQRPQRPICESARDARARNSPAAADLEAQCAAYKSPVTAIGRVDTGPSTPRPQRSICESAADARARNSPAAANLEAQCQALLKQPPTGADFELLRVRGQQRAASDPIAGYLRNALSESLRRGFDIGLGAWAADTAPGPGKQRYQDYLYGADRQGFDFAAAYALPRNKYAKLVEVGLAIDNADAQVRARRSTSNDAFFWLGFDIASGLFGDPRAGSEGSKVLGTGAIAIRDSLNAAGRSGFNASMQLHLARNYP